MIVLTVSVNEESDNQGVHVWFDLIIIRFSILIIIWRLAKTCLIWGAFILLFWGANYCVIVWSDLCDNRIFRLNDNTFFFILYSNSVTATSSSSSITSRFTGKMMYPSALARLVMSPDFLKVG